VTVIKPASNSRTTPSTPERQEGPAARRPSTGTSQLDLLAAQVQGIDAWNRSNQLSKVPRR
jgi:hypothetical protein